MICKKCKNHTFTIQHIPCCSDCSENGAWSEEGHEWIHDEKLIDKENLCREQVSDGGECNIGNAYGAGCYIFRCSNCNNFQDHLPLSDSCG